MTSVAQVMTRNGSRHRLVSGTMITPVPHEGRVIVKINMVSELEDLGIYEFNIYDISTKIL
jgi:hypothetical protein